MDTNTPIDSSADINHVEYLWRKRFHIDETPLEKFRYYLSTPSNWDTTQGEDMGYFFKNAPEYTIISERDETRDGYEYYLFGQVDHTPSWWLITLKYHQTAIEQFQGISLDGGRSFVVAPCRAYDFYRHGISAIGYYIQGDLRTRLLEFFHQKETSEEYSYRDYMNAIIVFDSENECNQFFDYVKRNNEKYRELCVQRGDIGLPHFPEIQGMIMDGYTDGFDREYFENWMTEHGIRWDGMNAFPLRYAAMKAGLGIIRKNNFFYTEHGSFVTLTGYVTDFDGELILKTNVRPCADACNLCQKACKSGSLCAPYVEKI